jgi:sensor histidine kinase regulating citrate/malate metabolism
MSTAVLLMQLAMSTAVLLMQLAMSTAVLLIQLAMSTAVLLMQLAMSTAVLLMQLAMSIASCRPLPHPISKKDINRYLMGGPLEFFLHTYATVLTYWHNWLT